MTASTIAAANPIPLHSALESLTASVAPGEVLDHMNPPFDRSYASAHQEREARQGHAPISAPDSAVLRNSLATVTDQDRLHYTEMYASQILALTNVEDALYFRRGVLSKETLAAIRYQKQRDHSVHTLHNYLLGWYFFTHSPQVREALRAAIAARKGPITANGPLIRRFAELWCYASLLHDVGYLFDGDIPSQDIDLTDDFLAKGRDYCLEYFSHTFWNELGLHNADVRQAAHRLLKTGLEPDEGRGGPGTIAYFLRNLGDQSALSSKLRSHPQSHRNHPLRLPADSFRLWALHYDTFHQPAMAARIVALEPAFYNLLTPNGTAPDAPAHMDHGVCGGLLLLKYCTWWFRAYFEADRAKTKPKTLQRAVRERVKTVLGSHHYSASHWWTSLVWATAAVAIHNIQPTPKSRPWPTLLGISEDPLAYLGILVDILQEWDRHSVRRLPTLALKKRCINSSDVKIGIAPGGTISLEYGCRDGSAAERQKDMLNALNSALADWNQLVAISFKDI